MNMTSILIMGVIVAFNFIIILIKINKKRLLDASIDTSILVLVAMFMSGSFSGLMVGTIASAIVSLSLLFVSPKISLFALDYQKTKKLNKNFKNIAFGKTRRIK